LAWSPGCSASRRDGLTRHGGRAAAPPLVIGALAMEVLWHGRHLRSHCRRRLLRVGLPPSRPPPPMSSLKRRVRHNHISASRKSRSRRRRRWPETVGVGGGGYSAGVRVVGGFFAKCLGGICKYTISGSSRRNKF
jgi:hypothetical protein